MKLNHNIKGRLAKISFRERDAAVDAAGFLVKPDDISHFFTVFWDLVESFYCTFALCKNGNLAEILKLHK